jgi:hypothetical protein
MESKPILVSVADAARLLSIGRTRRVPIVAIQEYIQRLMDEDAA